MYETLNLSILIFFLTLMHQESNMSTKPDGRSIRKSYFNSPSMPALLTTMSAGGNPPFDYLRHQLMLQVVTAQMTKMITYRVVMKCA